LLELENKSFLDTEEINQLKEEPREGKISTDLLNDLLKPDYNKRISLKHFLAAVNVVDLEEN
jgi:hypothetical protein